MASINDAQAQAFALASPGTAFNPNFAIPKKWLELKKNGTYIGVPIGDEMTLDELTADGNEHQRAQAFTSGVVLVWRGGGLVDVV